jgi:LacI family transcriptional regulator
MLTQKQIAAKANVSQMTVSRVINKHPYVRPKIRARIMKELKRNYIININARNLALKRSSRIGIIIPGAETYQNYFFTKTLHGISEQSRLNGYGISFIPVDEMPAKAMSKEIQGGDYFIIINFHPMRPYLDKLIRLMRTHSRRFILVQSRLGPVRPFVSVDNIEGGRMATAHLLEQGHRRIAFVGGIKPIPESEERRQGYELAMESADGMQKTFFRGKSGEPEKIINCLMAMPRKERPIAFFVWSDTTALSLIYHAARVGIQIPDELSIVGFDDFPPLPTLFHPHLTTIHQPLFEIGAEAVRRLFDSTPIPNDLEIKLKPSLVVRETTNMEKRK